MCNQWLIYQTAIQSVGFAVGALYFSGEPDVCLAKVINAVCIPKSCLYFDDESSLKKAVSAAIDALRMVKIAGDELGRMFGISVVGEYPDPEKKILEMIHADPADLAEEVFGCNSRLPGPESLAVDFVKVY